MRFLGRLVKMKIRISLFLEETFVQIFITNKFENLDLANLRQTWQCELLAAFQGKFSSKTISCVHPQPVSRFSSIFLAQTKKNVVKLCKFGNFWQVTGRAKTEFANVSLTCQRLQVWPYYVFLQEEPRFSFVRLKTAGFIGCVQKLRNLKAFWQTANPF